MQLLISLGYSLLLTPIARLVGARTVFVDLPSEDSLKIHRRPVPVLGGAAVIGAAVFAMASLSELPSPLVLAGIALALLVGVTDDGWSLPVGARVLVLGAAGVGVAVAVPAPPVALAVWTPVVVLLVLLCANAVNLADGQDGLAGGLAALAAVGLAMVGSMVDAPTAVGLGLALSGALIGFLVWNRPPASIFLGNGGAYAVGTVLAALAAEIVARDGWRGLFASGLILGIFALEMLLTVIRRLMTGDGLAVGDREHSYDLIARRLGRKRSTLVLWGSGALAAGLGVAVSPMPMAGAIASASALGAAMLAGAVALRLRLSGDRRSTPKSIQRNA